jgi:hypothetical protein
MKRKYIINGAVGAVLLAALLYFYGGSQTPSGQPPLRDLTADNLSELKQEFNAAKDETRVLLLLSPT